jgi:hypothetical protein
VCKDLKYVSIKFAQVEKDVGGLWRIMEQDVVSDLMYSASVSVALHLLWMLWPMKLKITYHEDCTMGAA